MLSVEIQGIRGDNRVISAERDAKAWKVATPGRREKEVSDIDLAIKVACFAESGYGRFTLYLEDVILVSPEPDVLVAFDVVTGTTYRCDVTRDQLVTIIKLSLGNEEFPDTTEMYASLENVLAKWPDVCRPMP